MEIFDLFIHCDETAPTDIFTSEELHNIFYGGIIIEPSE